MFLPISPTCSNVPSALLIICPSGRLKYLLSQSDIFSHFGVGGGKGGKAAANTTSSSEAAAAAASSSSSSSSSSAGVKRGRRSNNALNNMDEMDDDERAMAKDNPKAPCFSDNPIAFLAVL